MWVSKVHRVSETGLQDTQARTVVTATSSLSWETVTSLKPKLHASEVTVGSLLAWGTDVTVLLGGV